MGCGRQQSVAAQRALDTLAGRIAIHHEVSHSGDWTERFTVGSRGQTRSTHVQTESRHSRSTATAEFIDRVITDLPPRADGASCVCVRVARGSPLAARIRPVAEKLAAALAPEQRVLLLPPFKRNGVTSTFGTRVAFLLGDALRETHQIREVRGPALEPTPSTLPALLAHLGVDVLIYGIVDEHAERVTVEFAALDGRDTSRVIGSAHLELRGINEALLLLRHGHASIAAFARPLARRSYDRTVEAIDVAVRIQPETPAACDRLTVSVRTDHAAWITLLAIDPDGGLIQLIPDAAHPRVRTEAHIWRTLPDERPSLWQVERSSTPGPSRIYVVATDADRASLHFDASSFADARPGATPRRALDALIARTEALSLDGVRWGSAEIAFDVAPAASAMLTKGCP